MRPACTLAALFLFAAAARADAPPVHLVPADDAPLAALTLVGAGPRHPVLLVDARDQTALAHAAAEWKGKVECRYRRQSRRAAVDAMAALADQPCVLVGDLGALAHEIWPHARAIVVAVEEDYPWLLRAAAFAGATGSAFLPLRRGTALTAAVIDRWAEVETIYLTPGVRNDLGEGRQRIAELGTPDALLAELIRTAGDTLGKAVVVTNPDDPFGYFSPSALSLVAPLASTVHRAPLLLVSSADSDSIEREVLAAIDAHGLQPTHILLVGDELSLRSHRIPDPVLAGGGPEARGGGTIVRAELFSEVHRERPQDFAVGRIVAEDAAQASALLARQLHRRNGRTQRAVVFLTNADTIFALGETISRTTTLDMSNFGIPVRAFYRGEVTPEIIRQTMLQTDVLVWEGHPRDLTLEERGGIAVDSAPRIAVLQGCYTLDRSDPMILIEKGTEALVATSAAIYSASGSAFARALFDSALYDGADLGTAVRNARNYLLALALLKRERGYRDWTKTYRAALAFSLWGDPLRRLPLKPGRPSVNPVQWEKREDGLVLTLPRQKHRPISVEGYFVRPLPRAMYGGLVLSSPGESRRELKDLYFTAISGAEGQCHACPPDESWEVVSLCAPRTRTLSVLARPEWEMFPDRPRHGKVVLPLQREAGACPVLPSSDRPQAPPAGAGLTAPDPSTSPSR